MTIDYGKLEQIAQNIRVNIIKSVHFAGSGHPGGSLSAAEILTVLYFHEMNIDPRQPQKADRDRFVLSKGHGAPGLYSTLAERGFFPQEELKTLRKMGSNLQGHPDMKRVSGVEMSTGSLGQGFSAAVGMALADQIDGSSRRVYTMLGDGELQEGLVWEAAMAAGHYQLDNLVVIVDWNGLQIDGKNEEVMTVAPIDEKFQSFGFHVISVDGHSLPALTDAFDQAKAVKGKPTAIIAKTSKGKGVSFMDGQAGWHGKAPNEDEAKKAVTELGGEW